MAFRVATESLSLICLERGRKQCRPVLVALAGPDYDQPGVKVQNHHPKPLEEIRGRRSLPGTRRRKTQPHLPDPDGLPGTGGGRFRTASSACRICLGCTPGLSPIRVRN